MVTQRLFTGDERSSPQIFVTTTGTAAVTDLVLVAAATDAFYRIFQVDAQTSSTTGTVAVQFATNDTTPVFKLNGSAGSTAASLYKTKQDGAVNQAITVTTTGAASFFVHVGYSPLQSPAEGSVGGAQP